MAPRHGYEIDHEDRNPGEDESDDRGISAAASAPQVLPRCPGAVGKSAQDREAFLRSLSDEDSYQSLLLAMKDIVCGSHHQL